MAAKPSKNQADLLRSFTLLGVLLVMALGLLLVIRSRGRQDSLLGKPDEAVTVATTKQRSRLVPHAEQQASDTSTPKTAAQTVSPASDGAHLQRVMQLIDSGQWKEAEALLLELLQKDPHDEGALIEMAMLQLIDKHDSRMAQPYLERALEVNPDNEAAIQELLGVYEENHNWDQGLNFLKSLSLEQRKSGYVDYGIGSALISMGRPAEAVASLQKAVYEYGYKEYTAREGLAEALVDAGRIDEGMQEYLAIVNGPYKPNQIRVGNMRYASALIEKQQFGEAKRILQNLQENDPKDEVVASLLRDIDAKQKF